MLQAIADSIVDITQADDATIYGLSMMSRLNLGSQSVPLDSVILNVLLSKWDRYLLTPKVWAQGHRQRKALHVAGANYSPIESARLLLLMEAVMHGNLPYNPFPFLCRLTDKQKTYRESFLPTGSAWIKELAINEISNWSRISHLYTKLFLQTLTHMQDDPIIFGNCIHTLCLLSSTVETGGKIRDLEGTDVILKLLPRQFPEKRGEATPQKSLTLYNINYLTLRTLRHLTEPDLNYLYYPRLDTGANLRRVFDNLQAWMGDETSKGLTLQVLYNISRASDETGDPTQQDTPSLLDPGTDIDPNWNRMRIDLTGHTGTRALVLLYRLEIESHKLERAIQTLQHQPSQHHTTQVLGMKNPSSPYTKRILPRREDTGD